MQSTDEGERGLPGAPLPRPNPLSPGHRPIHFIHFIHSIHPWIRTSIDSSIHPFVRPAYTAGLRAGSSDEENSQAARSPWQPATWTSSELELEPCGT